MKLILITLLLLSATAGNAASLNSELVINGGAESGDMTGWFDAGGIEAVPAAGFAAGFGDFVFTGALGPDSQSAIQSIDLSGNAAAIDSGLATSIFSIYLQGRTDSGFVDTAEVIVTYRDGANGSLGAFAFSDTNIVAIPDWDFFSDTRAVPVGTRGIDIFLRTTRSVGASSDGFFDEVSLQLTAVPLPAGLWLALSGLVAMAQISRRA